MMNNLDVFQPIHIGTSGWSYPQWRGPFYPPHLPPGHYLDYYANHFNSVEINASFYRRIESKTVQGWRDAVPEHFRPSVKAYRPVTHLKKLKNPETTTPSFLDQILILGGQLGPVLFITWVPGNMSFPCCHLITWMA